MAAGVGATPISGANGSVSQQAAIVPSDSSRFPTTTRGIYVGTSGDVNWLAVGDVDPVVWKNVPVGIMPVQATAVYFTATGASNLVALW